MNSIHHQGVDRLGTDLVVEARSTDGVVEAIRLPGETYAAAVQWHPEFFDGDDPALLDNRPILTEFLADARRAARSGPT